MKAGPSVRRTVWTIIAVNVWERYAFYTMLTLLPLFLTGAKERGGLGWPQADALLFFGAYSGIVWSSPFLGGIVTDRWFGSARALVIGTVALLLGHLVLALPYVLPLLADRLTGDDISGILIRAPVPDGQLIERGALEGALRSAGADDRTTWWAALTHAAVAWSIYATVALIAIGNGLFKPTITLLLGRLDFASDGERDAAYSQLYMGRNIGSALAGFLAGALGAAYGWHLAFTTAAVGMGVALVVLAVKRSVFRPLVAPQADIPIQGGPRRGVPGNLLLAFGGLLAATLLFGLAYDQTAGLGLLFMEAEVDREILGWQIPSTWLLSLNPLFIILLTPIFAALWRRETSILGRLNAFERYGVGFVFLAACFGCFATAAAQATGGAAPGWPLLALAVLLLTMGELCIAPVGEARISKWAPAGWQTIAMGLWFASNGVGSWLSGVVGAQASVMGYGTVFVAVTAGAATASVLLFVTGRLGRGFGARLTA